MTDQQRYLSGVALSMADADLGAAVARQRLASRLTSDPVASLSDCVQLGRAVGLTVAEMQRLTGVARQTIYRYAEVDDTARRRPSRPQATMEIMVLLAASGGFVSPSSVAHNAGLDPVMVLDIATDMAQDGLCELRKDGYSSSVQFAASAPTFLLLREHFDDLFLRRPDAISVYIRVPDGQARSVARAAAEVLADHEHEVIAQSVVPSLMIGPELAFPVNAPTIRRALAIARDVWVDVLARLGEDFYEPAIANVIPAGSHAEVRSDVLDTFVEAALDNGAPNGEAIREMRIRFAGEVSETRLAQRCVTLAALTLRRVVDNQNEPRPIVDSQAAFDELQAAAGLHLDQQREALQQVVVEALTVATDRLGPIPAGGLAAFRAEGQRPAEVKRVQPTSEDLAQMARRAGMAVGRAGSMGVLDAACEMVRVVRPAGSAGL